MQMPRKPGTTSITTMHIQQIARLKGHNAAVFALAPAPEVGHALSAAGDGWIVSWPLDGTDMGRLLAKVDAQVFSLAYLPEQQTIVAGNMNGGLHWINTAAPDQVKNIAHHQRGVFAILPLGEQVLTAGGEGLLTRWDAREGRSIESLHLSNQSLRCMDYHPGRREIAVGASDNNIYLLDADTFALKHTISGAHSNSVFALRYHPSQDLLLSGGRDAHLRAWDLAEGCRPHQALPAHWFTINDIAFSPDGAHFATASRDKTVKIWDASTLALQKVIEVVRDRGHVNSVNALYWAPDSGYLLSASDDRSIGVWAVE